MTTLGLLKIKVFWNKFDSVIISVHGVNSKTFPLDSNFIVYVVMWSKFSNSAFLLEKLLKPQSYKYLTREKSFFRRVLLVQGKNGMEGGGFLPPYPK